jgi:hypothetical protein
VSVTAPQCRASVASRASASQRCFKARRWALRVGPGLTRNAVLFLFFTAFWLLLVVLLVILGIFLIVIFIIYIPEDPTLVHRVPLGLIDPLVLAVRQTTRRGMRDAAFNRVLEGEGCQQTRALRPHAPTR